MKNFHIGSKFYHIDDENNTKIIRLKKFDEIKDKYSFVDEKTNKYIMLTTEEIKKDWIFLTPDGYIGFTIVRLGEDFKDVVVALFKHQDLKTSLPYAICRQNITDYFSNLTIDKGKYGDTSVMGMSINRDNCPTEIKFETMLACDEVLSNNMISIYMDDTLDEIIKYVSSKKYNNILAALKQKALFVSPNLIGYVDTLKDMLLQNRFMFDFHMAFHIWESTFEIIPDQEILHPLQVEEVNKNFGINIMNSYIIKYSKDIDVKEFNRKFILMVCPINPKDIYIVGYDEFPT